MSTYEAHNHLKVVFVGIQSISHSVVNYAKSKHSYYNKNKFTKKSNKTGNSKRERPKTTRLNATDWT